MKRYRTLLLTGPAFALFLSLAFAQSPPAKRAAAMISIDGLRPDYITQADRYGLKIPQLRRLVEEGVQASARGVLPSVTYASHTTLVTGVAPRRHGIYSNHPFDRVTKPGEFWYWFAEDIRVPTLWDAAAAGGYVTGSVSWPVTVGAAAIRFNIPEYARTRDGEDLKMVRALATPGLLPELQTSAGPYVIDVKQALDRDWSRIRYAEALIRTKGVRFITVHLAATDHVQHQAGPFGRGALVAIEEVDKMVGALRNAIRAVDLAAAVCVVSDHGFAPVQNYVRLDAAFVKAGLVTLKSRGNTLQSSEIADWVAMPWPASGSAAIVLKDPKDETARARVAGFLRDLAADPNNGIAEILDRPAIAKLGGTDQADFWVNLRSGYCTNGALDGPIVEPIKTRGTHGYSPTNPDVNSFFAIAGQGIRRARLGEIDMRAIAPTVARALGVPFPTAEVAAVDLALPEGPRSEWNVREHIPIAKITVQSHRGAGVLSPENSMEAFELAWSLGTVPEADLRTTRDGVIVAFHDNDFKRILSTAPPEMQKLGIRDLASAEVRKLDIGSWKGPKFAGQRVPQMSEIYEVLQDHPERRLYIDIKNVDLEQLAREARAARVANHLILASTDYSIIRRWKELAPESATLHWMGGTEEQLAGRFAELRKTDFGSITQLQIHVRLKATPAGEEMTPSARFLLEAGRELRTHNILFQVLPWDSNDPKLFWRLMDLGVASFATDYPDVMMKAIRDYYTAGGKR